MELLKVIFIFFLFIAFFVGIAVVQIKLKSKKIKKDTCNNPDIDDKTMKCDGCSLTELCNYKE